MFSESPWLNAESEITGAGKNDIEFFLDMTPVNPDDTLSSDEIKLIKAAGLTHLVTGMAIASHTGPDNPAFAQMSATATLAPPPKPTTIAFLPVVFPR